MTYAASTVAYWVGQANDLSTGSHPTGWTSGQRWSETSNEWQTMYTTEYGNARDTSIGSHPTGWVSGQLWSTTASQWNTMYTTQYNAARDTSGGQTNSGLGAQHPSGWTNAQLWQTTAEQWNGMWGTEWRAARDPQGYTYSYPGQGANAVYWSQSAQYWRGQADYYWGPSRVWNNGATWEQNYNAYVGYYNDMVSQRDTWTSRANQAWGPSRVWSSGESWEAAYNRVLPPALSVLAIDVNGATGTGGAWTDKATLTVNRTGYWVLIWHFYIGGGSPDAWGCFTRPRWGGTIGTQQAMNFPVGGAVNYGWHTLYDGDAVLCTNGTVVAAQMNCDNNHNFGMTTKFHAVFVPTPTYPH